MPILVYGLTILNITPKYMAQLEAFQAKTLKLLLGLPTSTPNIAVLILAGLPTVEAVIDRNCLGMLGNIVNSSDSIEYEIMLRQIALKTIASKSWFSLCRRLLAKYDLPSLFDVVEFPPSKEQWKSEISRAINRHWEEYIEFRASLYNSLRYINIGKYSIGKSHLSISSVKPSIMDVRRVSTKLRLLTGTYTLQSNRAIANQHHDPTCLLCHTEPETRAHMLFNCPALNAKRKQLWSYLRGVTIEVIQVDLDSISDNTRLSLKLDP